jgi:hypothetical protein
MARGVWIVLAAAALYLLWSPPGERWVGASGPDRVFVTNFPDPHNVRGVVAVREPIPQTMLARRTELVPPGERLQVGALVAAAPLEAAGFQNVVLSLTGEVKGHVQRGGAVGVLLVPDQEEISKAFVDHGELQFPIEVQAAVAPGGSGRFHSEQPFYRLGFPRYRVYFYNTTERTAEATVYAYLGQG